MKELLGKKWKGISVKWWIVGVCVLGVTGLIACASEESSPEQSDKPVASTQGQTAAPAEAAARASEPSPTPEPVMEVDLGEVIALVDSNNVAADAEYKGKLVKLSGLISEIEEDYILLQAHNRNEFLEMNDAKCNLLKDERSKVLALRENQELTVTGRIDGFGTIFGIRVKIKDCAILSVE